MKHLLFSIPLILAAVLLSCATTRAPREIAAAPSPLTGKHCAIWRDPEGIVHTRAADETGAYACMGYLHGRERTFQVDYVRRAVQGRLSEILGKDRLRSDFFMRLMALDSRARVLHAALPDEDKRFLDAYAVGVNRGFDDAIKGNGAYELKKLGYRPEPWLPEHSVAVLLLQAFTETQATFWQEMKEEKRLEMLGPRAEALYRREGLPWDTAVLKPGEFPTEPLDHARRSGALKKTALGALGSLGWLPPPPVEGMGSNNWVLSPKWSRTKKAWLANDPHLELSHPPFWHWIHVQGGDMDVIGGSVPGVPLIASGLNRHVAWGLTDSYMDAGDIVAIPKSKLKDTVTETPTIWVKVGFLTVPFVFKSYARTKEGWPVLPVEIPGHALILRWTGYQVTARGIAGFTRLGRSRSVKEIDRYFAGFELPSWNFVFADTSGNVGYRVVGLIPRRDVPPLYGVQQSDGEPLGPWPLLSPDDMPHAQNPSRGFVVTANNRQWPAGARYNAGRAHPQGFRAYRIEELLKEKPAHDRESIRTIQCDSQATDGKFLVPKLLKLAGVGKGWSPREERALEVLRKWDFSTGETCEACGIYGLWLDQVQEKVGLDVGALYRALDENPEPYAKGIREALTAALDAIGDGKGEGSFPPWKEIHRAYFPHLSGDSIFPSEHSIPTPGNPFSVSPAPADWVDGLYRQKAGASHRLIVEMTSPPTAYFTLAGPNMNGEEKELDAPDSPWLKWRDCRLDRVRFPLDWDKVKGESITL